MRSSRVSLVLGVTTTAALVVTVITAVVLVQNHQDDELRTQCAEIARVLASDFPSGVKMESDAIAGVLGSEREDDLAARCPSDIRNLRAVADGAESRDDEADVNNRGTYDADNEENFAMADHTCEELRSWYRNNPGDSNAAIASKYGTECEETPPPVLSGELSRDDADYELPVEATVLTCEYDPFKFGAGFDPVHGPEAADFQVSADNNTASGVTLEVTARWEIAGESHVSKRTVTLKPGQVKIWSAKTQTPSSVEDTAFPTCDVSSEIL